MDNWVAKSRQAARLVASAAIAILLLSPARAVAAAASFF